VGARLAEHLTATKELQIEGLLAAKGGLSSSWSNPSIVAQSYECQLDICEIEQGLRDLVEQQLNMGI